MSLHLKVEKVKPNNRESLLNALRNISDFDCDFTGENGEGYTWKDAIENGFNSNLEYLINEVKDIEDDKTLINTFFDTWMNNDRNYYDEYEVQCINNNNGNVVTICFATVHEY